MAERKRYQRQTVLAEIGAEGQQKLSESRVAIIGCGGLGSPAAAYLAGAGVGEILLIDGDKPEESNLHRQVFFDANDPAGKADQLGNHLRRLNPTIKIVTQTTHLNAGNARTLLSGRNLILDCTDDAHTKHLISDACATLQLPLVYAAAQGFAGYVAIFENQPGGINLRDLYPEPDPDLPDCATAGVLPTAVGIVALLQANAALCYLLKIGSPPIDRLLTYSALDNTQHRVKLQKNYHKPIPPPWKSRLLSRAELEVEEKQLVPAGYDAVFSMLTEAREPELPKGAKRLSPRNPLGQCLDQMQDGNRYLLYCNSGKLSLVLAAQIRKERPGVEVYSLRGGVEGIVR